MKITEATSELGNINKGAILTIGNFDGVHLGHQEILKAARKTADQMNTELILMTFEPHPAVVLHRERAPGTLTPLELKKALLSKLGPDHMIVLKDSYELLNLSPQDFVDKFLMKQVEPSVVVEGNDFNFGYGRSGSIDTLIELAVKRDFEVKVVCPYEIQLSDKTTVRISSTLIRHLLHKGHTADAAKALARPYRLIGQVIEGKGKGRQLGYPTANINPLNQIIPDEGVYAGFVEIEESLEKICIANQHLPAVFSIGRAKTFITDHPLLIEAHLLDAHPDKLYGKWLAMDFIESIRHQQRFKDEQALSAQIAKDCQKAKQIIESYPCPNS